MSVVEKVANAIAAEKGHFPPKGGWSEDDIFVHQAKAAIEALREPSEGMVRKGVATHCDPDAVSGDTDMLTMFYDGTVEQWNAMIDAALED